MNLDLKVVNALKGLVIDGVGKANSGHPGGAMGSMSIVYYLFTNVLKFDPQNPKWQGRDRFVLSAGHMSMQLYSLLHANGWLELEELKKFRQLHSKTPGHPECDETPGVECTTGPLGQGAAMSVGIALASKHLQARLDQELFDYNTYSLLGDGCMQEEITMGAASYAGHLGLNNLVWIYDRNKIQISGTIDRSTSDNDQSVYEGFGWEVWNMDGKNHDEIKSTLEKARHTSKRKKPLLIIANTLMAEGCATMEGTHKTHGAPLPAEELKKTKEKLGLPADKTFYFTSEHKDHYQRNFDQKSKEVKKWQARLDKKLEDSSFSAAYQKLFDEKQRPFNQLSAIDWDISKPMASRNAFGKCLEQWGSENPEFIGGSADLEPSNMTGPFADKVGDFHGQTAPGSRNLSFGVREFPMSAIANGIALSGNFIPFTATFLCFSDYSRPALRLGALQKVRVIHEFTHDSFYLGEDGPTHQPVEHVMSLRAIPEFYVYRPADSIETEECFKSAVNLQRPSALCLTRQKLPYLNQTAEQRSSIQKGAYILSAASDDDQYIIFATGSEVSLAQKIAKEIPKSRVVSIPCWKLFFEQSKEYQDKVLAHDIKKRISIEAGISLGWQKFTGTDGVNISIDHFGASAPASDLEKDFGFTKEAVLSKIKAHFS